MLLKYNKLAVVLGGITMTTHNYLDTYKSKFVLDSRGIVGWYDGVDMRRDITARPISTGDFAEKGYKGGRVVSLSGYAKADTIEEAQMLRDQFTSILSDGGYAEMGVASYIEKPDVQSVVTERFLKVGLEGAPTWIQQTDLYASFKIDLYAPDPRLYSAPRSITLEDSTSKGGLDLPLDYPLDFQGPTISQAIAIWNVGNTESWPIFIVTGDYYAGFEISDGNSKKVRYEGIVSTASPVLIDLGAGVAMQNGTDKSNLLTRRDWFSIPPNSSIQPRFYPIEDAFGWCDIIYRDTWI